MDLMIKNGTYYVPTISAGEFVAEKSKLDNYFPEIVRPKAAAVGPQIGSTFGKAYKRGVKIALVPMLEFKDMAPIGKNLFI